MYFIIYVTFEFNNKNNKNNKNNNN
jgi:hypothetical protein